jgi:hypothetical protein
MVALHWGLQVGDRGLQLIDNKFSKNLAEPIGGGEAMHGEGRKQRRLDQAGGSGKGLAQFGARALTAGTDCAASPAPARPGSALSPRQCRAAG